MTDSVKSPIDKNRGAGTGKTSVSDNAAEKGLAERRNKKRDDNDFNQLTTTVIKTGLSKKAGSTSAQTSTQGSTSTRPSALRQPTAESSKDVDVLAMWRLYKSNPVPGPQREKVILHYLHLVRYVVSRLPVTLPVSIGPEDLLSYGTLGLIEAVERFDVERGLKFETYAITRIRGSVIDQLRVQDWIPRGVRKRSKNLQEAMVKLEQHLGRNATEEELSLELGVTIPKVRQMVSESNNLMMSLDESWGGDESQGNSLLDLIEDQKSPDPEGEYESNELRERLTRAINALPEREKLLIALYYHENMTLREIGEIIQVSESRVCQLHAQAILRLRNKLSVG